MHKFHSSREEYVHHTAVIAMSSSAVGRDRACCAGPTTTNSAVTNTIKR
jgi:hypothetical protein